VAIIGRTGSGKSTLAQLLLRQFDPQIGQILVDGQDLRTYEPRNLRGQIGYVPQDVFLFSDTIAHNISFGSKDANPARVKDAARQASVDTEIDQFAQQYDTMVGERGVTLSGGQKQRVSIARALYKNNKILVFDDCLSAVDAKTEKQILGNLHEVLKDKTALIITHRIFSLLEFDQILVMDKGTIIERGTHQSLMEKEGYYASLYRKQQTTESADSE
jgi:ATP-binding cassette subfamily B protein